MAKGALFEVLGFCGCFDCVAGCLVGSGRDRGSCSCSAGLGYGIDVVRDLIFLN